jgi:hypothetical protein
MTNDRFVMMSIHSILSNANKTETHQQAHSSQMNANGLDVRVGQCSRVVES